MTKEEFNALDYDSYIKNFTIYDTMSLARKQGYEAHHIIPKSIQKELNIDDDRCIRVTSFEHILIHYLLAKKYGNTYIKVFYLMYSWNNKKCTDIEKITLENLVDWTNLREIAIHQISKSKIGNIPWNKGIPNSKEVCKKISEANSGKHWWNNGKIEMQAFEQPNESFVRGRLLPDKEVGEKISKALTGKKRSPRSDETKKKISDKQKGKSKKKQWYTDGKHNILSAACPDGFKPGRTFSIETKIKMSESQKGRKDTDEIKQHKSNAMKEYYSNHIMHTSIKAIDIETKEIFNSIKEGLQKLNFKKTAWRSKHNDKNSIYYRLQKLSDYEKSE